MRVLVFLLSHPQARWDDDILHWWLVIWLVISKNWGLSVNCVYCGVFLLSIILSWFIWSKLMLAMFIDCDVNLLWDWLDKLYVCRNHVRVCICRMLTDVHCDDHMCCVEGFCWFHPYIFFVNDWEKQTIHPFFLLIIFVPNRQTTQDKILISK